MNVESAKNCIAFGYRSVRLYAYADVWLEMQVRCIVAHSVRCSKVLPFLPLPIDGLKDRAILIAVRCQICSQCRY